MTVPTSLAGAQIAQISISSNHAVALVTKVLEASKPTIAGTAAPGQTLTATPGTFSGTPTGVTGQWRADGADIAGATSPTFTVTTAQAGKRITFASTAAQGSAAPVVSVSAPTAIVAADSATSISPTAGTYGRGGGATIRVTNAAGLPVTGTVTVSGAGAPQTVNVSGGSATIALGASLPTGSHTLTATYSGSTALKPSSSAAGYGVAKGKTKRPAFKVSKAATSKKKGKATVTVSAPSGLAKASGKVTVTIKGKSNKTIKTTLSGGKKSITLPKLKKGTYKVTVSYAGDKNYVAQKSSTIKVKVKK